MNTDECPLGWVPLDQRTNDQIDAHEKAMKGFIPFMIAGGDIERPDKVVLNEIWNHPVVVKALGFKFPRVRQITGSCVWCGGVNAAATLLFRQAIYGRSGEVIGVPFGLNNYARSRRAAGMLIPGSGSLGSTFAASLKDDGLAMCGTVEGMPKFTIEDGIVFGGSTELKYSVVGGIAAGIEEMAKSHPVKGVAQIKTIDQLIDAIQVAKCSLTWACSRYIGNGTVKGSGDDAVVVGSLDSRGGHQTSLQGYWKHPTLGPLIKNQNNWPASSYPADPDKNGTPCAVWQRADDLAKYLDNGDAECYLLSGYENIMAESFSWNI